MVQSFMGTGFLHSFLSLYLDQIRFLQQHSQKIRCDQELFHAVSPEEGGCTEADHREEDPADKREIGSVVHPDKQSEDRIKPRIPGRERLGRHKDIDAKACSHNFHQFDFQYPPGAN